MAGPEAPQNFRKQSKSPQTLAFPSDIYNAPFATILRFSKYNREISFNPGSQVPAGAIVLPLPTALAEHTNLTFNQENFSLLGSALTAINKLNSGTSPADLIDYASAGKVAEGVGKLISKTSGFFDSQSSPFLGKAVREGGGIIGGIIENVAETLPKMAGQMLNPHTTILFSGVSLRAYVYTWKFSPRNLDESLALKDIVDTIRWMALPGFTKGGLSFTYPHEVQLDFTGNGIENFIFGTKRTNIQDVSLDYSPDGNVFYTSGAPVSVSLNITLNEVAVRTSEDYKNSLGS